MLLLEIEKETNRVISAAQTDGDFIGLPDTSYSLHVSDEALADRIWQSHINGGNVTFQTDGSFTIDDVTPITPEPEKSEEQLLIEQQQRDIESIMLVIADLYEQVLTLQGGS